MNRTMPGGFELNQTEEVSEEESDEHAEEHATEKSGESCVIA